MDLLTPVVWAIYYWRCLVAGVDVLILLWRDFVWVRIPAAGDTEKRFFVLLGFFPPDITVEKLGIIFLGQTLKNKIDENR